jgi:hypothetical protein
MLKTSVQSSWTAVQCSKYQKAIYSKIPLM